MFVMTFYLSTNFSVNTHIIISSGFFLVGGGDTARNSPPNMEVLSSLLCSKGAATGLCYFLRGPCSYTLQPPGYFVSCPSFCSRSEFRYETSCASFISLLYFQLDQQILATLVSDIFSLCVPLTGKETTFHTAIK
jgi:hypothetical protein